MFDDATLFYSAKLYMQFQLRAQNVAARYTILCPSWRCNNYPDKGPFEPLLGILKIWERAKQALSTSFW